MLEPERLHISPMQKTWILDLDGTIPVTGNHYGYEPFSIAKEKASCVF